MKPFDAEEIQALPAMLRTVAAAIDDKFDQLVLREAEQEIEKLRWQLEKAARRAGYDIADLDKAWNELKP
jgi:hypothetical protein